MEREYGILNGDKNMVLMSKHNKSLFLTIDEAVRLARKFLNCFNNEFISDESVLLLKDGEYCITFKSGQVVHIDAHSGEVMEPENGYLVTRR